MVADIEQCHEFVADGRDGPELVAMTGECGSSGQSRTRRSRAAAGVLAGVMEWFAVWAFGPMTASSNVSSHGKRPTATKSVRPGDR